MADQYKPHERKSDEPTAATLAAAEVEAGDRGLFDLLGKKTEEGKKCEDKGVATELDEKVKVSEEDTNKHESLLDKFSSSDEKGIGGKKKDTNVPIAKFDDKPAAQEAEEKKGFLDKIKEKLPGGKKPEDVSSPPPTPALTESHVTPVAEEKEKKGFVDKIKEKIPGQSKGDDHVEKEKEK